MTQPGRAALHALKQTLRHELRRIRHGLETDYTRGAGAGDGLHHAITCLDVLLGLGPREATNGR